MTDRDLMQQALDAMRDAAYDEEGYTMNADLAEAHDALEARLAQCDRCGKKMGGEGDIHTCTPDPIGDAQDRLIAEMAAQPEQEPVGEVSGHDWSTGLLYRELEPGTPLYTAPPAAPVREPFSPEAISATQRAWQMGYEAAKAEMQPEQEPVACLSKTQAKAILDLALDLEKTGRMVVLTEGQERTDFAARNRNIQCALEDALRNATTPPAAQRQWVGLTDKQMVDAIQPLYQNRAVAEMAIKVSMDEFRAIEAKLKEKNT